MSWHDAKKNLKYMLLPLSHLFDLWHEPDQPLAHTASQWPRVMPIAIVISLALQFWLPLVFASCADSIQAHIKSKPLHLDVRVETLNWIIRHHPKPQKDPINTPRPKVYGASVSQTRPEFSHQPTPFLSHLYYCCCVSTQFFRIQTAWISVEIETSFLVI